MFPWNETLSDVSDVNLLKVHSCKREKTIKMPQFPTLSCMVRWVKVIQGTLDNKHTTGTPYIALKSE